MKTFWEIRQELNEGYESNRVKKTAIKSLSHVDEISDKKLDQYYKKAAKQYSSSAKKKDDPGYTDAKRAQHADRYRKRSKGIGGYFQRDLVKRNIVDIGDGKPVDMGSGSRYLHKQKQRDYYSKGKKGMTMTGRPASAMPKAYRKHDRG